MTEVISGLVGRITTKIKWFRRACTTAPRNTVTNVPHTPTTPRLWEVLRKEIYFRWYRVECNVGAALVFQENRGMQMSILEGYSDLHSYPVTYGRWVVSCDTLIIWYSAVCWDTNPAALPVKADASIIPAVSRIRARYNQRSAPPSGPYPELAHGLHRPLRHTMMGPHLGLLCYPHNIWVVVASYTPQQSVHAQRRRAPRLSSMTTKQARARQPTNHLDFLQVTRNHLECIFWEKAPYWARTIYFLSFHKRSSSFEKTKIVKKRRIFSISTGVKQRRSKQDHSCTASRTHIFVSGHFN